MVEREGLDGWMGEYRRVWSWENRCERKAHVLDLIITVVVVWMCLTFHWNYYYEMLPLDGRMVGAPWNAFSRVNVCPRGEYVGKYGETRRENIFFYCYYYILVVAIGLWYLLLFPLLLYFVAKENEKEDGYYGDWEHHQKESEKFS